jgi:hypothetical protein
MCVDTEYSYRSGVRNLSRCRNKVGLDNIYYIFVRTWNKKENGVTRLSFLQMLNILSKLSCCKYYLHSKLDADMVILL